MGCDAMRCDGMGWHLMRCDAMGCDGMRCDAMGCDGMRWDGTGCDASGQAAHLRQLRERLRRPPLLRALPVLKQARERHARLVLESFGQHERALHPELEGMPLTREGAHDVGQPALHGCRVGKSLEPEPQPHAPRRVEQRRREHQRRRRTHLPRQREASATSASGVPWGCPLPRQQEGGEGGVP
jgi:hypothetical protein